MAAFENVAVIPMDTDRVLLGQTVLVEGGRVTALGPTSAVQIPAGAMRIDGRGKYLIPGLADMHTHVGIDVAGFGEPTRASPDSVVQWRLFQLLADGVTTIRNVDYIRKGNGRIDDVEVLVDGPGLLRLRARAAAGELWSPKMYVAGQWAPDNYIVTGENDSSGSTPAQRLDSISTYLAAYKAAGYDFVKVHWESPEVFDSVLAAGRRLGIPVVGHVRSTLEAALAGGMRSIEHMTGYPQTESEADARALAEATKRAGTWNCVTMQAGGAGATPVVVALQRAGAGLLLGSDAPLGKDIHAELKALVRIGLTPYQALVTGTRNVAAYFNTLDDAGTIAVGKRADLVLLDGNPLEQIQNAAHPAGVMIGGRWLSRQELDRRLDTIKAAGGTGR